MIGNGIATCAELHVLAHATPSLVEMASAGDGESASQSARRVLCDSIRIQRLAVGSAMKHQTKR